MNTVTPGGVDPVPDQATQSVTEYSSDHMTESASDTGVSRGITPEIIAVIEAAATAFVGKTIRILSVKILLETAQDSTSWADKGRDIVHASHNTVQRGH
jgi:hypothetical protein